MGTQPGQRDGRERAAQAIADQRRLLRAGDGFDDLQGGEGTLAQVIVEPFACQLLIRVHPGDDEYGIALFRQPFDERALGLEVEDIIFVDPGGYEQQRNLMHFFGGGLILNQLHQVVLVNHRTRCRRDILAQLERFLIRHRDAQLALAFFQVPQQVRQAVDDIVAVAFQRRAHHFWVGEHEIAGRHRVDELAGEEMQLAAGMRIQPFNAAHRILQPAGIQQVALLDVIIDGAVAPAFVLEAAVLRVGRHIIFLRLAEQLLGDGAHQVHMVAHQAQLGTGHLHRVEAHMARRMDERFGEAERVGLPHRHRALHAMRCHHLRDALP